MTSKAQAEIIAQDLAKVHGIAGAEWILTLAMEIICETPRPTIWLARDENGNPRPASAWAFEAEQRARNANARREFPAASAGKLHGVVGGLDSGKGEA